MTIAPLSRFRSSSISRGGGSRVRGWVKARPRDGHCSKDYLPLEIVHLGGSRVDTSSSAQRCRDTADTLNPDHTPESARCTSPLGSDRALENQLFSCDHSVHTHATTVKADFSQRAMRPGLEVPCAGLESDTPSFSNSTSSPPSMEALQSKVSMWKLLPPRPEAALPPPQSAQPLDKVKEGHARSNMHVAQVPTVTLTKKEAHTTQWFSLPPPSSVMSAQDAAPAPSPFPTLAARTINQRHKKDGYGRMMTLEVTRPMEPSRPNSTTIATGVWGAGVAAHEHETLGDIVKDVQDPVTVSSPSKPMSQSLAQQSRYMRTRNASATRRYTPEERLWLHRNYRGEATFLKAWGLDMKSEKDREEGALLVRELMRDACAEVGITEMKRERNTRILG